MRTLLIKINKFESKYYFFLKLLTFSSRDNMDLVFEYIDEDIKFLVLNPLVYGNKQALKGNFSRFNI